MRMLSFEEIKKITVGAVNIENAVDGFRFYKCTKKQMDGWYALRQDLGQRSETTTGIRLDFYTNSKNLSFKVKIGGRYEVYINGVLNYAFKQDDFERNTEKNITLDGQRNRITLYLPCHTIGAIEWIKLDKKSNIEPHKYDCKILFLGDSITQGWDSKWDSLSYAHTVSRFFNADSIIQGIGGATFQPSTFDRNLNYEADIVIIAYGTNDWDQHKDIEKARNLCSGLLECVMEKYSAKKIFGISPIWRGDKAEKRDIGTFDVWTSYIKDEIEKHGVIFIDGQKLTPHNSEFYFDKFLHPNAVGHSIFAQNLIKEMQCHF